jgi:mannose-6-phosphate isomerase
MHWYPLRLKPVFKTVIWGGNTLSSYKGSEVILEGVGESWAVSAVPGSVSVVEGGPLAGQSLNELLAADPVGLLGQAVYDKYGPNFPLLIKFIDAAADLSIQVHPDDALAASRHQTFGKSEMWYVIAAQPGSKLVSGFSKRITPEEYEQRIANNTIEEVLCYHTVQPGDVFSLPAGRVHAIGAGILLAEIQQSSDITYRLYDYNRKDAQGKSRELHTAWAKEAIDYTLYPSWRTDYPNVSNQVVPLVKSSYFTTNRICLDMNDKDNQNEQDKTIQWIDNTLLMDRSYEQLGSFVVMLCMEGEGWLRVKGHDPIFIHQGQTLLVPAAIGRVQVGTKSRCLLLESYIEA